MSALGLAQFGVGFVGLLLAAFTLVQTLLNDASARRVEAQAKQLERSRTVAKLDDALVQAMAQAAVDDKDDRIRALLVDNGVTLAVRPSAAAPVARSGG